MSEINKDSDMYGPQPAGAPRKVNDEIIKELLAEYKDFVKTEKDPNVAKFVTSSDLCFEHLILPHNIYDWQEFAGLRKLAIAKQEAYLIEKAGDNKYNPTLAIFRLKQPQHGYRDRVDTDVTSGGEKIGTSVSNDQLAQLAAARARRSDT